jgi:1-phosphatidylinositol phosphodiesterase
MNNWLKNISDDIFISDINLAGTHNSCAHFVNFSYITQCQNKSIKEQLHMGIRFLDIRLEKDGNTLKAVHSIMDCYKDKKKKDIILLTDILADCENFLKENPSEFIIVCVKKDDGKSDNDTSDEFFKEISENPELWYLKNSIPRLSEVRGKLILFNRFADNKKNKFYNDACWGLNACEWDHSGVVTDSAYSVLNFRETKTNKKTGTLILQDKYKMGAGAKWKKSVLPTLNANFATKDVVLNFFSAANIYRSPKGSANYIFKRFNNLSLQKNKKIGWIILDYPTEEVVKKIVETNFA